MPFYKKSDRLRLSGLNSLTSEIDDTLYRDGFHDDVARLVHSPSFRRLVRKRQLLPSDNSDFVRNRLTHSNEVAQVATSITSHLNRQLDEERRKAGKSQKARISPDVVVFAGLAHDIGHPPFGHLGEVALNAKMLDSGGFEGNAQTLRILTRLERRLTSHDTEQDGDAYIEMAGRYGLNLTFRCIASILKYNSAIPVNGFDQLRLNRKKHSNRADERRKEMQELREYAANFDPNADPRGFRSLLSKMDAISDWESDGEHPEPKVVKGFYAEDLDTVKKTLINVYGDAFEPSENTQSIECQIMDFADDVAYSIYDLEDCLKTEVVTPEKLLSLKSEQLENIANEITKKIYKSHVSKKVTETISKELTLRQLEKLITPSLLSEYLYEILGVLFHVSPQSPASHQAKAENQYRLIAQILSSSAELSADGRKRRKLTNAYISRCCASATIDFNQQYPAASKISYPLDTHIRIEFLKRLNFHLVISSDLIKADEHRGEEIVSAVFDGLFLPCDEFKLHSKEMTGYHLLPEDVRKMLDSIFEKTALEILEIRQALARADSFLDEIVRKHPRMRAFSLKRMLNLKNYEFRYSLAISLYEEFLRNSKQYSEKHAVLRQRRTEIKRLVCDFIAGMTDRGLIEFYRRLKFEDKRVVMDEFSV